MATPTNPTPRHGGSHFGTSNRAQVPQSAPASQPVSRQRRPRAQAGVPSQGATAPRAALSGTRVSSRTAAATRRAGSHNVHHGGRSRRRSRAPFIVLGLVAVAAVLAVVFVILPSLGSQETQGEPQAVAEGTVVSVSIPEGSGASVVADLLLFTRKEQEETPMPASEPAEQPADVFDPAAALDALGGEALLKRLAGIFLGEEPNIRANLQRFALSPETLPELCPELRRQAHSLKNGAGMLHLESLRKASSDLEQAAASPAGQDFAALLRTTIEALERASAALRKHCGA